MLRPIYNDAKKRVNESLMLNADRIIDSTKLNVEDFDKKQMGKIYRNWKNQRGIKLIRTYGIIDLIQKKFSLL